LSSYKTVTESPGWRENRKTKAFSEVNGRITYIEGYKPDFSGECKNSENFFAVYIDGKLW